MTTLYRLWWNPPDLLLTPFPWTSPLIMTCVHWPLSPYCDHSWVRIIASHLSNTRTAIYRPFLTNSVWLHMSIDRYYRHTTHPHPHPPPGYYLTRFLFLGRHYCIIEMVRAVYQYWPLLLLLIVYWTFVIMTWATMIPISWPALFVLY